MKITRDMIICALAAQHDALQPRIAVHEVRAERLAQKAHDYDDETIDSQEPHECARLDRLIDLSNEAHDQHEALIERARLIQEAISALEDERKIATPRPLSRR